MITQRTVGNIKISSVKSDFYFIFKDYIFLILEFGSLYRWEYDGGIGNIFETELNGSGNVCKIMGEDQL